MCTETLENKIDFKVLIGFHNVKSRHMMMKEIKQNNLSFRFYIQFIRTETFLNNRIFHGPKMKSFCYKLYSTPYQHDKIIISQCYLTKGRYYCKTPVNFQLDASVIRFNMRHYKSQ